MASRITVEQIVEMIEQNKIRLIWAGGTFVIVLLVCMSLIKFYSGFSESDKVDNSQPVQTVATNKNGKVQSSVVTTYLPETKRKIEVNDSELRDPFVRNMSLKGIIIGGDSSLAIIELGTTAYIAGVGKKVAEDWTVAEITGDGVVLKSGSQTKRLEFSSKAK